MTRFAVAAALCLPLLAACGGAQAKTALNPPVIDTLPGGVVRVKNTGPTLWTDTNGWKLVLERTIQPAEGSPGEIGDPNGVIGDAQGNAYLLQEKPTVIKVYGPDGAWVRDIGREGDGPGEFRNGMFGIYRDTLFVQDPNNSRLTTFRTTGEFIASAKSQCCWWTSNFPTFEDGTIGIMGPGKEGGALFVTHMNGTVVDSFPIPSSRPKPGNSWTITMKRGGGTSMMSMGIPLQPSDRSAYLPNRTKIVGHTGAYEFAVTSLKGDTLRRFSAPATVLTITETQRDSIFQAAIEKVSEQWRAAVKEIAKKEQIPTQWPLWSDVAIDGKGRIWIGRPGAKGEVTTIDVFSKDGILLGTVPAPHLHVLDGYWIADLVYLRDETEEGTPVIRIYRIKES